MFGLNIKNLKYWVKKCLDKILHLTAFKATQLYPINFIAYLSSKCLFLQFRKTINERMRLGCFINCSTGSELYLQVFIVHFA